MTFALIKEILRRIKAQTVKGELASFELFSDGSWRFNVENLGGPNRFEEFNKLNSDEYNSFSDLMDDLREKSKKTT